VHVCSSVRTRACVRVSGRETHPYAVGHSLREDSRPGLGLACLHLAHSVHEVARFCERPNRRFRCAEHNIGLPDRRGRRESAVAGMSKSRCRCGTDAPGTARCRCASGEPSATQSAVGPQTGGRWDRTRRVSALAVVQPARLRDVGMSAMSSLATEPISRMISVSCASHASNAASRAAMQHARRSHAARSR
jgi:hypothetical protein